MKKIGIMSLMFVAFHAWAAPFPATTSSLLTDPEKGNSFRSFGFTLELRKSQWRPIQKEAEGVFAEIQFVDRNESKDSAAQISMRMDEIQRTQHIEAYAKRWMRDYPQYGFEVLGTKTFSHSGGQGLVVDLFHRPNNKQTRQVILLKQKKVAILTCSHDRPKFSEILPDCNQMIKNFSWLDLKSEVQKTSM